MKDKSVEERVFSVDIDYVRYQRGVLEALAPVHLNWPRISTLLSGSLVLPGKLEAVGDVGNQDMLMCMCVREAEGWKEMVQLGI